MAAVEPIVEPIVQVRDLSFTYPGLERPTLKGCSLELHEGEIMSILGPNGSGKSTLLNCMCGLLSPQKGKIVICGHDIRTLSFREVARRLSYVQQQHNPVFSYSVLHFVMMGRAPDIGLFQKPSEADRSAAMEVLEDLGIAHLADRPYTDISGGERQQATIARAIVQRPKAILFDEPTAHLDYGKQLVILRMIRRMTDMGFAAVMTTHNPDHTMMLGGTVAIVDREGGLETGPVDEVVTERRLKEVYETDLSLIHVEGFRRPICVPPDL